MWPDGNTHSFITFFGENRDNLLLYKVSVNMAVKMRGFYICFFLDASY